MIDSEVLLRGYFRENKLIESSIESFNYFMERELQKIIEENKIIEPTIIPPDVEEFKIRFDRVWAEKPQIIEADGSKRPVYPIEARLRKITYASPMFIEVSAHVNGVQRETFVTQIGSIPIMLKSKFCHLNGLNWEELIEKGEDPDDPGGYFIINGSERVIISMEDLAPNRFLVDRNTTGGVEYTGKIFSESGSYKIPHMLEKGKDGIYYLSFTRVKKVPLAVVIKALGLTKDEDILKAISEKERFDEIVPNLYEFNSIKSSDDAVDYMAKRLSIMQTKEQRIERIAEIINKFLLPHIGNDKKDKMAKAYNLCKMLKKYILVERGQLKPDDKDHYMNKKLKLSGDLLADLIRINLRILIDDMLYTFQRIVKRGKFPSIRLIIREKLLTSRIYSSMATGNWVGVRKGVSQRIQRLNFLETVSHLQRVVSPLSSTQENFKARELHATHLGRLCLSKDTHILLADNHSTRTLEQLQNCWQHHKIMTFDTDKTNLKDSAIINYFCSNPKLMNKKVYKISAESGRTIIATSDHPFYTPNGWKDAGKLDENDLVAVYPTLDPLKTPNPPNIEKGITLINDGDIKKSYPNRYKHYIKELKNRDLLPFTTNNYYAEIIARLQGHLMTDGHCSKHNLEFYCGSEEDANGVAKDIRSLGFEPSKIDKKVGKFISRDGRTTINITYRLTKGGALHSLLVLLGTPIGRKTETEFDIPQWLFKTELSVKREFLAAYLGGDGNKPRCIVDKTNKSGKIQIDNLFFHKNEKLRRGAEQYAQELIKLFKELEVSVKRIRIEKAYTRKDGSKTIKVILMFNKSNKNYKNLLQKIGYRYCIRKNKEAMLIGEWLRLHEEKLNDKIKLKKRIRQLYHLGMAPKTISKKVDVSYRMINSWLYERKYDKTSISRSGLLPYDQWLKKAINGLGNTPLVWQRVVSKQAIELDDVRDLTTKEDAHTIIANGFITHNCPVETPEGTNIGLRKNFAMLCRVSGHYENEKDIVKRSEQIGLLSVKL